jgi:hypothetical protein
MIEHYTLHNIYTCNEYQLLLCNIFSSGIAYTVIRPGSLKDGPSHKAKLIVGQTNASLGSSMTRSDLADICFEASFSDNCKNVTFEIGSERGQIGIDSNIALQKLFDSLSISWDDKWV